ncbi:MAG: hypothetical protein AB7F86_06500 [Bdellovibrionales bacterium]
MKVVGSQRGQFVVEALLILVVLIGLLTLSARFFREQELVKKLISGPWVNLAGMLQNGVWQPADAGAVSHPNGHTRHISIQGEAAR